MKFSLIMTLALLCTHLDPKVLAIMEVPSWCMANQIATIIWLLNQASIPKFLKKTAQNQGQNAQNLFNQICKIFLTLSINIYIKMSKYLALL